MTMAAGRLAARRHRITLMSEESHFGDGGRKQITTPILAEVWAEVSPVSFSVQERGGRENSSSGITTTCVYQASFTEAKQLEWRGNRYRITQVGYEHSQPVEILKFTAKRLDEGASL